jgi:hypothetical protein
MLQEYGAAVFAPRLVPSILRSTLLIVAPLAGVALTVTEVVPEMVAPLAGEVMLTVGGLTVAAVTVTVRTLDTLM